MRPRARLGARLALGAALLACAGVGVAAPRRVAAQTTGSVAVFGPPEDTLRSVTPTFTVQIANFPGSRPLRITLQFDTDARFDGTPVVERTVEVTTPGNTFTIAPDRALPQGARLYFRALVSDPSGVSGVSLAAGPKVVPPWVTPVSPPTVVGQPVRTRTPRFVWRSPQVDAPPGPWRYTVTITSITRGTSIVAPDLRDTAFIPGEDLEPNAVYSWSIRALLPGTGQAVTSPSPSTFLVEDSDVPVASTELYPPFPNPFPSVLNDASCIWFDLRNASFVSLDVHDLRGVHVRRLVPNGEVTGALPPGRYGRGRTELNEGCDRRFEWDGTDDRGQPVPEGVYLIYFRADGIQRTKKVLFRGRR